MAHPKVPVNFSTPRRAASHGRFGDSLIAFLSPQAQAHLASKDNVLATINPLTGLPEYADISEEDELDLTSGDNSSNIGTAIDYSEGSESTAGELASTDGETTFGQFAANEAGPAHINPAEYASLQKAGYAPQILSSNFGNFDDINFVNPNAPI